MAIFEKTIRNQNFDQLLRKLEQEIPDSSCRPIWKQAVTSKKPTPGAVSVCLSGTA